MIMEKEIPLQKLLQFLLKNKFFVHVSNTSFFWKCMSHTYPYLRDALLAIKIVKHSGRQPFLIGKIKKECSLNDIMRHLEKEGYEKNVLAWIDDGEILSVRKKMGSHQLHIRIFCDGEVRAHKEPMPECRPYEHLYTEVTSQKKLFQKVLNDFIEIK